MQYGLNQEQWNSIISPSPTVVNASAGSGKTRCLISKIRYVIDNGINPKNILAITFTNRAANEIKNRLKNTYNIKDMQISTIHSMCVKIIKNFISYTPLKTPFSIYDDSDQLSVVKTIIKSRGYSSDPYEVLSIISRVKSDGSTDMLEGNFKSVYKKYQEILKANNACDFDDLLIYANDCLKHDDCQRYFSNLWQHILVDEAQDTSKIQNEIILSIYNPNKTKTMLLLGDFNQSIYSWRGAHPDNMKNFIQDHKANVCDLTYNYRSCPEIISHANHFLQYGKPMVAKSTTTGKVSVTIFQSQEDEAEKIAQALMQMGNYEDTAIIYRMNARSLHFEKVFSKYRIPYKVVGELPFYKRKVAKDLICYMKAANNPSDIESLTRIINTPKRGFGEAKKESLLLEGVSYLNKVSQELPTIKEFLKLMNDIKGVPPTKALNEILIRTKYQEILTKESDLFMVSAMKDIVTGFDSAEELILASTFLEKDTGNGIKLMTAHASKGLEFKRVFLVGAENEVWPHKNSLDLAEEERLYYVAITRAESYLNISYSKSKNYRGTVIQVFPSRYFKKSYQILNNKELP